MVCSPVFIVEDETGRVVRTFQQEEKPLVLFHHQLDGLRVEIERDEAAATAEMERVSAGEAAPAGRGSDAHSTRRGDGFDGREGVSSFPGQENGDGRQEELDRGSNLPARGLH